MMKRIEKSYKLPIAKRKRDDTKNYGQLFANKLNNSDEMHKL